MSTNRERRAARITDDQIERVIAHLEHGCSIRAACASTGVNPSDLRWRRHGDPAIGARVDTARITGFRRAAAQARDANLDARAEKLEARAVKVEHEGRDTRERHRRITGLSVADYDEIYG